MPSATSVIQHRFAGGWATDFGTFVDTPAANGGFLDIPFLLAADNVYYEEDGGPHKIGGSTKVNSSALASGADVTGVHDFWRYSGGTATQVVVAHAGTGMYNVGTGANITGATLTADAIPDYTVFNNLLIYTSDADAPRSWDGSTDQALAGSPPNFAFSEPHKNRVFAAGVASDKSGLYASAAEDPEDWTGLGSVYIKVSPDDGDEITAIRSYRGELWIFKGPHRGSIWRLQGSAPGSSDPFRLIPYAQDLGGVSQRTTVKAGNDIVFMHIDGTVHSLRDTSAVAGQYQEAALSRPINTYMKRVVPSRLKYASAAYDPIRGYVVFNVSVDSATTNNQLLLMDNRFQPPRWSAAPAFSHVQCVASVVDSSANNRPIIMTGGSDGFVRRFNQVDRRIEGGSPENYFGAWKTPFFTYGAPFNIKGLSGVAVSLRPKGNYPFYFTITNETGNVITQEFTQSGGDVLGPASANVFRLNQSKLGGSASQIVLRDVNGGQFRAVQYAGVNAGIYQDMEVSSFATRVKDLGLSFENSGAAA